MLRKFLGLKSKAAGKAKFQIPPLPGAVSSAIVNTVGARSIPPMPAGAQKAFQLSTDPSAEARDFVDVIESDEGLSARVLKVANSVFFDRGKPSKTIEEAVLVIGINELRCLLNATTLSELFPSRSPLRAQLWSHDIATAVVARSLAQRHLPNQADLIFLGGLMHDIGKLLLVQRSPQEYARIVQIVEREGVPYQAAETQIFPFDHTEVGQLIGERWHFSVGLQEMIRGHHQELTPKSISPVSIIWAADTIAHSLGLGDPPSMNRFKNTAQAQLEKVWELLKAPPTERELQLNGFCKEFEVEYEKYSGKA